MCIFFLFRYAVAFAVWVILIGCILALFLLCALLWYLLFFKEEWYNTKERNDQFHWAIWLTIFAIAMCFSLIASRRKVRLLIVLFKEATKVTFDLPALMTIPVICVIAVLILSFFFVLTTFYMASAGTLQYIRNDYYSYVANPIMLFTMGYTFVMYFWISQFFTGIQYMIIAGAVSKWYYARDKDFVGTPIMTSISNTFRFHLGTVALGGLIIFVVQVIKNIIVKTLKCKQANYACQSIIEALETFFKCLSKNAYIITAMHGQPFIRSGKRSTKLIIQNISDIISINSIGDFVLIMAKILIVVLTVLLSFGVFAISPGELPGHNKFAYMIIAVFSAIVACIVFGVFETTIDTLFICYCEDSLLNDGMARPYFMSRNLKEFVQSSKEVYRKTQDPLSH